MTIEAWLKHTYEHLQAAGIGTARLEALVLLEDVLKKDRSWILAHQDMALPDSAKNVLNKQIRRRATHEPLAYVRGKTEFYGRDFVITSAVLEPRPESETMIDMLKTYVARHAEFGPVSPGKNKGVLKQVHDDAKYKAVRVADVGAGSGALGITAYLELENAGVDLIELDNKAIEIAKMNVINLSTGQKVIKSDLLADATANYDILLCNLPYVPDAFHINEAAMREPKIAIFGGSDGLDLYRRLFVQLRTRKNKPLLILTESLPPQHGMLAGIAAQNGYEIDTEDDFIQAFVRH